MKIMEILVREAVILNVGVRTKREVLAEMAAALAKVEPQIEADRLLEVLLEREALQSTGIGEGVAIPHGKMAGLDRLVRLMTTPIRLPGVPRRPLPKSPRPGRGPRAPPPRQGSRWTRGASGGATTTTAFSIAKSERKAGSFRAVREISSLVAARGNQKLEYQTALGAA